MAGDLFTGWIAAEIQIINITVLAFNLLLAFSFLLIGSVNIAIIIAQFVHPHEECQNRNGPENHSTTWEIRSKGQSIR
jgi:hypothetical protein